MVVHMKEGSVIIDISIDQGGCFENIADDHSRYTNFRKTYCALSIVCPTSLKVSKQHSGGQRQQYHPPLLLKMGARTKQ